MVCVDYFVQVNMIALDGLRAVLMVKIEFLPRFCCVAVKSLQARILAENLMQLLPNNEQI